MTRTDREAKFAQALDRIRSYDSPERLRRHCEKDYGLAYEEALELAYENMREEARAALRGYRPPKARRPAEPTSE